MMDLRKIDKGQMEMHFAETDIVAFTRGVMRLFYMQARNRQISLELKTDSESIPVWIDRANFDKVLMNLLSNAFKFTHTGGNILITIRHDAKNMRLTVADDGDTIPEDKIDRIFERFYQGSTSIQGRQSGTGVGLDLARSIIDLHHGTISARNTDDPKGCAFDIDLPMGNAHLRPQEMVTAEEQRELDNNLDLSQLESDTPEAGPSPAEEPAPAAGGNRPHIVVVDDEDDIRRFIAHQLQANYQVTECSNGKEALAVIQREQPALVVSDVMMPEMDGFTLCAKLKSNINTNHIPVVLLTAKGRDEDKTEGIELGADAYISKPFSMDLLRSTIGNLLRERALLRNKYSGHETMEEQIEDVKLQTPDDKLLERVVRIINNNLPNEEFSVDMLADQVGISRVHLYRKMKELTNQTPSEFIRNVRLKQAANLLADPHQSIAEVMYACGFSNRTSFSTMFKKFYGVSPREYMQEAQKKADREEDGDES
jgi:DNA-binding response OmpR family regulator